MMLAHLALSVRRWGCHLGYFCTAGWYWLIHGQCRLNMLALNLQRQPHLWQQWTEEASKDSRIKRKLFTKLFRQRLCRNLTWTINNTPLTQISQVIFLIISDLKVMHRAIYFKNSNSTHWNCNEWSSNNSRSILQWSNLLYSYSNTSIKCPGMLHFVEKKNHFCSYSVVNPSRRK